MVFWGLSIPILHLKSILLAILVDFRSAVAADGRGAVDDPWADEVRVVAEFDVLQAVAAVERPFADIADALRDADGRQPCTFKESTVLKHLQGTRQFDRVEATEIKSL